SSSASGVDQRWNVAVVGGVKQVAALRGRGGAPQVKVNHASVGLGRTRRAGSVRRSQYLQSGCVADRRIGCAVGDLRCVNGAQRADRRGFVGRNTRPQQVWNGDRSDDQNDRDHDQQLNQWKTLLFPHLVLSPL